MRLQHLQDYNKYDTMWKLLLLISGCIFSSDQDRRIAAWYDHPSAAASSGAIDSRSSSDSFASPEEKEELYTRALWTIYPMGYEDVNERLKIYLDRIVAQSGTAPNDDELQESNVVLLRRLRSGDIQDTHQIYIKRLVMKATSQAFEDQEKKLEEQKKETEDKFSKLSTAIIALISSIITSTGSVLVAIYSQK